MAECITNFLGRPGRCPGREKPGQLFLLKQQVTNNSVFLAHFCVGMRIKLKALLELIRWKNLLIIFITQLLVWGCVIRPLAVWSDERLFLSGLHFFLLSLSTLCIAAAGYIINDYFDLRIDLINKPDKIVIEKHISRRGAIMVHSVLNAVGLGFAVWLSWRSGNYWLWLIQLACTLLLWFYSTTFKRQFITGNIAVSILVAFTILALAGYESALRPFLHFRLFFSTARGVILNPLGVIIVYAFFAFTLTWMREIVKDMEDFKGDVREGCLTMPIKWGIKKSTTAVIIIGIASLIPLVMASGKLLLGEWRVLGVYVLLCLVLPLIAFLVFLYGKNSTESFARASRHLKVIMVLGVLSLPVYYILQF